MLRLQPGERRSFPRNLALAFALSLVAGAVNASGSLAAGAMTSHMTGNLTRIGEGFALGSVGPLEPARYVLVFLIGAFGATLAMHTSSRRGLSEPVPALLLVEAALLSAVATAGWFATRPILVTEVLCFAMGWQNALITRISGAVVRTTHMTGTTTDLGIVLGNLVFGGPPAPTAQQVQPSGLAAYVRSLPPDSDAARAAMHFVSIFCFLAGATLGPLLLVRYGYKAMYAPVTILLALVLGNHLLPRRASSPAQA